MCTPLFWLLCYWLIVESLDPRITASKYISVCKSVITEITRVSFVDDIGLGVTSDYVNDLTIAESLNNKKELEHIITKLKILAQHWEELLFTTGGAINFQKSFWYLLSWSWENGVPQLNKIIHSPGTIELTTGYNATPVIVPCTEQTAVFGTLGVYTSPSGSQEGQIKQLRAHAQQYFDALQSSHLTLLEAFWPCKMFLRPKLKYPLPCSALTQAQCRMIQAPAPVALLPKLHWNCHSPHSVLFASPCYGGLSIPDHYIDQGFGQLTLFI